MERGRLAIGTAILAPGAWWIASGVAGLGASADIFADNTLGLGIATAAIAAFVLAGARRAGRASGRPQGRP